MRRSSVRFIIFPHFWTFFIFDQIHCPSFDANNARRGSNATDFLFQGWLSCCVLVAHGFISSEVASVQKYHDGLRGLTVTKRLKRIIKTHMLNSRFKGIFMGTSSSESIAIAAGAPWDWAVALISCSCIFSRDIFIISRFVILCNVVRAGTKTWHFRRWKISSMSEMNAVSTILKWV